MGIKEAALYLHVPFCIAKCPYCDFYSIPLRPEKDLLERYLEALKKEIFFRREEIRSYRFVTFYAGGGTPSLLPPDFYRKLFDFLTKELSFSPVESTLEANPEGLDLKLLRVLREIFNRLSIGAQSLLPEGLKALGRRHSVREVKKAFFAAREAGFSNIGLDFIFAWPGETLSHLKRELEELVALKPEHVSYYELTFEEGTLFYEALKRGELSSASEEEIVIMYDFIHSFLEGEGYEHYEISNFARPGFRCLHNLFYWKARPYLGLGPGAASYLGGRRSKNIEDLSAYFESLERGQLPPREEEVLSEEARFREAVILGLRLLEGIHLKEFEGRFRRDVIAYYGKRLESLVRAGLVEVADEKLRLTPRGRLLANVVFRELV